jgi:hypothetical protein
VLSGSPCERIGKWKISEVEIGQFVGVRLAGAYLTKPATLLGTPRATVSEVMLAYTKYGRTTSAKRKAMLKRKRSSCIEKDRLEKSHTHCSTGDSRTEY